MNTLARSLLENPNPTALENERSYDKLVDEFDSLPPLMQGFVDALARVYNGGFQHILRDDTSMLWDFIRGLEASSVPDARSLAVDLRDDLMPAADELVDARRDDHWHTSPPDEQAEELEQEFEQISSPFEDKVYDRAFMDPILDDLRQKYCG